MERIPKDVWIMLVTQYLDPTSAVMLSYACKSLRTLFMQSKLFKVLLERNYGLPVDRKPTGKGAAKRAARQKERQSKPEYWPLLLIEALKKENLWPTPKQKSKVWTPTLSYRVDTYVTLYRLLSMNQDEDQLAKFFHSALVEPLSRTSSANVRLKCHTLVHDVSIVVVHQFNEECPIWDPLSRLHGVVVIGCRKCSLRRIATLDSLLSAASYFDDEGTTDRPAKASQRLENCCVFVNTELMERFDAEWGPRLPLRTASVRLPTYMADYDTSLVEETGKLLDEDMYVIVPSNRWIRSRCVHSSAFAEISSCSSTTQRVPSDLSWIQTDRPLSDADAAKFRTLVCPACNKEKLMSAFSNSQLKKLKNDENDKPKCILCTTVARYLKASSTSK